MLDKKRKFPSSMYGMQRAFSVQEAMDTRQLDLGRQQA
jgi:hypothetical protein